MNKYVKIPLGEYITLMNDRGLFLALEGAGVDNWQGYDYALDDYEEFTLKDVTYPIIEE